MTPITQIFERRLLAALAQAASTCLPKGWETLQPDPASLRRPAAAVLLGVAEEPTRGRMVESLQATASRIKMRREGREGGAAPLFCDVARLLEALDDPRQAGDARLLGLALWEPLLGKNLDALYQPFLNLVPKSHPVTEPWLAEAARVLLRARAQAWEDEARKDERASKPGAKAGSNTPTTQGAAS